MAKKPTLEEKVIKWKEAHSSKNEKGEHKDEKTGKAIPNKEQKQVKEKQKPQKIDYKKFYKDKDGKVDKQKKAMVKQIRKDYKMERKALKNNCKSVAEYKDKRAKEHAAKAAGFAARSSTMAVTKCPHAASLAGKGAEKAAYKGVEVAQRKTREKWAKNPEKYSKQIAQRVKDEKKINANTHQNKHMSEAQMKYRLENLNNQPSQKKMDNWVKENQAKPKTPKQKKPDYSSLYRNKDGTINKEKKALVKQAEKRYAQERKAYNKGYRNVASMKDEGKRQLAAKSAGVAASQASNAAFKKMDLQHGKNAITQKMGEKGEDKVMSGIEKSAHDATYKAVENAQKKHQQKLADNEKHNGKVADRVMNEKQLRSNNNQNKFLSVEQMKYRMRQEKELNKYKDSQKQQSAGKKAEKPAKTQEAKKPEAKKTDEYGISVPEKKETKTEQKEQGRGR